MAGFVEHLFVLDEALSRVVSALDLSEYKVPKVSLELKKALGALLYEDLSAASPYPPYSRSTRDGYAVSSRDTWGASPSSPVFLTPVGEVPMGSSPLFSLRPGECALIHTGGAVPEGADAVVMLEDVDAASSLIEVRRSVQKSDNIVQAGEEYVEGELLLRRGTQINARVVGILASLGFEKVDTFNLKVGVISSGDEIVDIGSQLSAGKIRDVNSWTISSFLRERGYDTVFYGIVPDDKEALRKTLARAQEECHVVLISGGSSVSERDYTSLLLEELPAPGLIVRGLRVAPGKPTLIAGSKTAERLILGLPGHPLSCIVILWCVVLPLLSVITSGKIGLPWKILRLPAGADIFGRTGIEEFIPCRIEGGRVYPIAAKSAYVGILREAFGFIHLKPEEETLRRGDDVEVCLW